MTHVDELQRELVAHIEHTPIQEGDLEGIVHRARRRLARRRVTAAAMVIAAVVAIVVPISMQGQGEPKVVSTQPPAAGVDDSSWQLHSKAAAGLGSGTSLDAVATTGQSLLLAGARPIGPQRTWRAAIWYSDNASSWHRARVPTASGEVDALAADSTRALAIGTDGSGISTFVWTSTDHGRHWRVLAHSARLFGAPAPQMGRPGVSALRIEHGTWIASGGGSSGYAAIWTSQDGKHWRQVLDSVSAGVAGSVDITNADRGRLFGYWVATGWYTSNGSQWDSPVDLAVPDRLELRTVAAGATVAFGDSIDVYGRPTPLLRSRDHGHTWTADPAFLTQFPDAQVLTVTRTRGLWVAAGTSGNPNHPDAWVSTDLTHWHALPAALHGAPGGTLSIISTLRHKIVLVGTAPELDRYYTLDAPRQ